LTESKDQLTCPHCGYIWTPRKSSPRYCPACKRFIAFTDEMIKRRTERIANRQTKDVAKKLERIKDIKIVDETTPKWVKLSCSQCSHIAQFRLGKLLYCAVHLQEVIGRDIEERDQLG